MKSKPYPKYKPSGVEWLGDVPEHWEIKRLKHLALLKSGEPITTEEIEETGDHPVYGGNGIRGYTDRFTHEGFFVLIGRQGALCGNINYANDKFWASEHAVVVRPSKPFVAIWMGELLRCMDLNQYSISAAQPGLSIDRIKDLHIPIPPLSEQQAIADFLDRETGRIDALIEKKERLLELLADQRAALISRAVTRGLDPSVKLKPSGVEWLGDIPGHWEVKRVKHIANIRYGVGEPPEYVEDGVAFIRATNVNAGMIESENLARINPEDIPFTRRTWLKTGDIIVVRSGAYTGDSAIIPEEYSGSIAGFDMVVSCRKTASSFLAYALLSKYLRDGQIFLQKMRAAQPHLNAEELGNCLVFLPPLTEQHAIADFLDRETTKIEALSGKVKEAIKKLREYRSALISATVTGKSCVKEVL